MKKNYSDDDEFDARLRRLLRDLPVPAELVLAPPRRRFLRVGLAWAAGMAGLVVGAWATWREFSAPSLVRAAFAHAHAEAQVRGLATRDFTAAQAAFGVNATRSFPGVLQLCKDCVLNGQLTWHVNVYRDDEGYIHLFAFQRAPLITAVEGQSIDGYWRFFTSSSGFTVLALAQSRAALSVITRTLAA